MNYALNQFYNSNFLNSALLNSGLPSNITDLHDIILFNDGILLQILSFKEIGLSNLSLFNQFCEVVYFYIIVLIFNEIIR